MAISKNTIILGSRKLESKKGFILLRPRLPTNSDKLARAIAMCNGVSEVFLTSGDYGFVIRVKERGRAKLHSVKRSIGKIARGSKISIANMHYLYKG